MKNNRMFDYTKNADEIHVSLAKSQATGHHSSHKIPNLQMWDASTWRAIKL